MKRLNQILILAIIIFSTFLIVFTPLRPQITFVTPELKLISTPTPIEEVWQTYRNDQYGFELKYPINWFFSEDKNIGVFFSNKPLKTITGMYNPETDQIIIKYLYFHSAFENGLGVSNYQDKNGIQYVSDTKFISPDNFFGSQVVYQKSLNNSEILLSETSKILSTFKLLPITSTWKTYKNTKNGFELKYPSNLILSEKNNIVNLRHFINYENSGDCDMTGGTSIYQTLDDFNITFEIKPKNFRNYEYSDGKFSSGILNGDYAVIGSEYCGNTEYYFPLDNKTLLVTRANIQALSGYSTAWDLKKILSTPGSISQEKSNELFTQILSTFKFLPDTSTWKTYKNTKYGFEFKYPSKYKVIEREREFQNGKNWEIVLRDPLLEKQNIKNNGLNFINPDLFQLSLSSTHKYSPEYDSDKKSLQLGNNVYNVFNATKYEMFEIYYFEINKYLFSTYSENHHLTNPDLDQILSTFKFTP